MLVERRLELREGGACAHEEHHKADDGAYASCGLVRLHIAQGRVEHRLELRSRRRRHGIEKSTPRLRAVAQHEPQGRDGQEKQRKDGEDRVVRE